LHLHSLWVTEVGSGKDNFLRWYVGESSYGERGRRLGIVEGAYTWVWVSWVRA